MTGTLKTFAWTELQTFDQGKIQEFVAQFLPLYDKRFYGIEIHGGTIEGKTRPGIPDLIKTNKNSSVIASECSVEQDYWQIPEKRENAKPLRDAKKCFDKLPNLAEIVLLSNRSPNTRSASSKSIIIFEIKKYFSGRLTLIDGKEITDWIITNIKKPHLNELLRHFFPDLYKYADSILTNKKFTKVFEIANYLETPIDAIWAKVNKGNDIDYDPAQIADAIILETLNPNRFYKEFKESFNGIIRESIEELTTDFFINKVVQLIGVPRIGKTYLCRQLFNKTNIDIIWLAPPFRREDQNDFISSFFYEVLKSLIPPKKIKYFLSNKGDQFEIDNILEKPQIVIIDDFHRLDSSFYSEIAHNLSHIQKTKAFKQLGIIFISNIQFNLNCAVTSLVSPKWSKKDIQKLLAFKNLQSEEMNDDFFNLLASLSGGHPLLATTLATECSNKQELILKKFKSPNILDEDLSKDFKNLLYSQILTTSDKQNFVQRLSVLFTSSKHEMIEAIRIMVEPKIITAAAILMDEIGEAVIEGNLDKGIEIALVYREVAKTRISKEEVLETYKAVAKTMLNFSDAKIDGETAINGINYSYFAGELGQAYSWIIICVHAINKQKRNKKEIEFFLKRLYIMDELPKPKDPHSLLTFIMLLNLLSIQQITLDLNLNIIKDLQKISIEEIDQSMQLLGINQDDLMEFKNSILITRFFNLAKALNPMEELQQILSVIIQLNDKKIDLWSDIIEYLVKVFNEIKDKAIPIEILNDLIFRLFPNHLELFISLATGFGSQVGNNKSSLRIELTHPRNFSDVIKLFDLMLIASYELSIGNPEDAIRNVQEAEIILEKLLKKSHYSPSLFQLKADVNFSLKNFEEAYINYKQAEDLGTPEDSYAKAWNMFNIGVLTSEFEEAIQNLQKAINLFTDIGDYEHAGRATGALAIWMIKSDRIQSGLKYIEQLYEWYYDFNRQSVAPAIRLLLANMVRYISEKGNRFLNIANENHPELEPFYYRTVSKDLNQNQTQLTAYYILGFLYDELNLNEESMKFYTKILTINPINHFDKSLLVIALRKYISEINVQKLNPEFCEKALRSIIPLTRNRNPNFEVVVDSVLGQIQNRFSDPVFSAHNGHAKLLDIFKHELTNFSDEIIFLWEPEYYYTRSLSINVLNGNRKESYWYADQALINAIEMKQIALAAKAGMYLVFNFPDYLKFIYDIAEKQYEVLQILEQANDPSYYFQEFGQRLSSFWRKIIIHRFRSKDLEIRDILVNTSKEISKTSEDDEKHAPVMINLMCSIFRHQGLALHWSKNKVSLLLPEIPDNFKEFLI